MIVRITSLLLLALFLSTEARLVCIHVDYLINKEIIARTKCEQKDVPESTCDGKCYLRKQIVVTQEDSTEDTKKSPAIPSELRTDRTPVIINPTFEFALTSIETDEDKMIFSILMGTYNFPLEVESPPPQC